MSTANLALVADPDPTAPDLYRPILKSVSLDIVYAEDGRDALAIAIGRLPAVVVTETRLPLIDGYVLCSLLRTDPMTANIPIVVVTVDAGPSSVERALASGADRVLAKPCQATTLVQSIVHKRSGGADERLAEQRDVESQHGRNVLVRAHRRFETTAPPCAAPPLRCPSCDRPLLYVSSHIGGVSARCSEQWDDFTCTKGCGRFQYRHRTRRLRRLQEPLSPGR